jgi:hypothetical protein
MSVDIATISVQGASGRAEESEDLAGYAHLANHGSARVSLTVQFHIDNREAGQTTGDLEPGAENWFSAPVGHLAAGGHDLKVLVGIDDGQSSSQADNGISFTVEAMAAPAPSVDLPEIHLQPHTNVEHPAGHAWSNEQVRVSVLVHNKGMQVLDTAIAVDIGGRYLTHNLQLAAGAQEWVSDDVGPFQVGDHVITATASTETVGESVLLATKTATLTVSEPTAGWQPKNVQVVLHDFRGRPLSGRAVFLEFYGMDGAQAGGAETVQGTTTTGGVLTRPGITIPPRGTIHIMAVSTGQADEPIENTAPYHLADGEADLSVTADQESKEAKITAKSIQGVKDKLSGEMSAGLEIEVLSIGGKVGSEHEESQEFETEVEWEVRYGRPSFKIAIGGT